MDFSEFKNNMTLDGTTTVASGSGTFQKIIIASSDPGSEQTYDPGSSTGVSVTTNATAGEAVLPAGATEITIKTPFVTDKTMVYITPASPTQNKVLYVSAKKADEWFKVAIDSPVDFAIKFNWWIIN